MSVESACDRCSAPIIGRHGRGSSSTTFDASTSTVTGPAADSSGVHDTTAEGTPSTCTSESDDTAYHRSSPGVPVVSTYGGCGTEVTSRPPWSSGDHGPSIDGATCTW